MKIILIAFFTIFTFSQKIYAQDGRESKVYSLLISSLFSLDNSELQVSNQYCQQAVELCSSSVNRRVKALAYATKALWYQKRFPGAKDIIGRQENIIAAIDSFTNIPNKTNIENKLLDLLKMLRDNTFYNIPDSDFFELYKQLIKEKTDNFSDFIICYLKFFTNEEKYLKIVDDYTYYLGENLLSRARIHAMVSLSILNSKHPFAYTVLNPELLLKKSVSYYTKIKNYPNDSLGINNNELEIVSKRLTENFTDFNTNLSFRNRIVPNYEYKYFNATYNYKEPPNCTGTSYAAIEIGADGVKLSVICVNFENTERADYEFSFLKIGTYRTNFQELQKVNISKTYDAVKNFYDTIVNIYNIPDSRIFIAYSSGAYNKMVEKNRTKVMDSLKQRFIDNSIFRNINDLTLIHLEVKDEARLTLLGVVPSDVRKVIYSAGIIDVGTGNIKGGYCKNNNCNALNFPFIESDWGLGKILSVLPKNPDLSTTESLNDYLLAAEKKVNQIVVDDIGYNLKDIGLRDKTQILTTGGIFWAIATFTHPNEVVLEKKNFVQITEADVKRFKDIVMTKYPVNKIYSSNLEISNAIQEVVSTFPIEKALVGALMVQSIFKEFNKSTEKSKKYYYCKYSVVGWPSGLIIKEQIE